MTPQPEVRRRLRPGDAAAIVAHHGRVYAREYGLNAEFRAHVGASVARAVESGWPGRREGIWIVELGGELAGSIALTDEGNDEATVRWFLLDAELRGRGLGTRLVAELLTEAEGAGYAIVGLETFSELTAAARIYRRAGFELVWEDTRPRWGRAEITYQRYELGLSRSSASPSSEARAAPAPAPDPSR